MAIIEVRGLSKKYRLGATVSHDTLRDSIAHGFSCLFKRDSRGVSKAVDDDETIWALKDVSFDVREGEILGIIGRNGAGKSTLLKILSRITEPTRGEARLRGRVGSLLEVGTGFHPELTGRENIFLNGAILGMRKEEIKRKFDEIVAFAEVEKFLDTPVKRYSSGMYVRLAFAVAANMEPDILIIDEVLAVGDVQFQKKCLGKMDSVAGEGRTVLFVSHNMQAVMNLCPRSILLDKGMVVTDSSTEQSLSLYRQNLRKIEIDEETAVGNETRRRGGGAVRITSASTRDVNGDKRLSFEMGQTVRFVISYKAFEEMRGLVVYIALRSGITREIVTSIRHIISSDTVRAGTSGTVVIEMPNPNIRPGEYPLYLHLSECHRKRRSKMDVVDDLTAPLVIVIGEHEDKDFDPLTPVGYLSIPSGLLSKELDEIQ